MNIPPWLLSSILFGMGTVAFFSFRYVLQSIKDNRTEYRKEAAAMAKELKDLKTEFYSRVSDSEDRLVRAIKDIAKGVVPTAHCDSKQEIWTVRFENLINVIETANETRAEADKVAHTALETALRGVVKEVSQLSDCVTSLANKKEC